MNEFQLVFRGVDGNTDETEYRFNDTHDEARIDGRLISHGETYKIRGVDWIVTKDDSATDMPRFICTLVVEPVSP